MLRPYQEQAVQAIYQALRETDGHPVACLPTGSGKSHIIARVCCDAVNLWSGRVLVLAHVQELLEQNAEKIRALMGGVGVGVFSAGLGQREASTPVVVAGIQSVYRRGEELGRFDLVLIDEAHRIPVDADTMYQTLLTSLRTSNPDLRMIGLTATPFRLKGGPIYGEGQMFSGMCYNASIRELIRDGFLCPLIAKAGQTRVNMGDLHVRAGEFMPNEVEALMDAAGVVESACAEIADLTKDRRATLLFCAGVEHARHVANTLREKHGLEVGTIFGDTDSDERSATIDRFKSGALRYLANVNVLTTGFDAPHIDCVVMLRPTLSAGLYAQALGRGFRLAPGKTECLVLDYGGNVIRHGPVDQLAVPAPPRPGHGGEAPAKECPQCRALIAAGYGSCPLCGYVFPPPDRQQHDTKASTASVLSQAETNEYEVKEMSYGVHTKKGAGPDAPRSLRVEYEVGWNRWVKEWICVEHHGYARGKAETWWLQRSKLPCPTSAEDAYQIAIGGKLAEPTHVTVRTDPQDEFPERITGYRLGPIPDDPPPGGWCADGEEPPF